MEGKLYVIGGRQFTFAGHNIRYNVINENDFVASIYANKDKMLTTMGIVSGEEYEQRK